MSALYSDAEHAPLAWRSCVIVTEQRLQATGIIIAVQEGRFRLSLPDGRSALFVLSHNAPLEPQDLIEFAADCIVVTVRVGETSHLDAKLALDIIAADGERLRHRADWS